MKKIVITMIVTLSLIIGVVACQVYDQNTNETISTSLNDRGSWEDFLSDFGEKCENDDRSAVLDSFLSYDEFFTRAVKNLKDQTNDANKVPDVRDVDAVKAKYKSVNDSIIGQSIADNTQDYSNVSMEGISIKALWKDEYKLKWDYNSKK